MNKAEIELMLANAGINLSTFPDDDLSILSEIIVDNRKTHSAEKAQEINGMLTQYSSDLSSATLSIPITLNVKVDWILDTKINATKSKITNSESITSQILSSPEILSWKSNVDDKLDKFVKKDFSIRTVSKKLNKQII